MEGQVGLGQEAKNIYPPKIMLNPNYEYVTFFANHANGMSKPNF